MHHHLTRTLLAAAGAAALLAGCDKGLSGKADTAVDPAAITASLKADEVQWNADYKAKDVARLLTHYAPSAALMAPDTPLMVGTDAIKAGLTQMVADPALDLAFSSEQVAVATGGDLAYNRGHYRMTATDPKSGKPFTQTGSFVTIFAKQADGSWKAVEDIATPTLPPMGPPAK